LTVEVVVSDLGDASEGIDSAKDVAYFVVAGAGGGGICGADGGGDGVLTVKSVVFIFGVAFDAGIDGEIFVGFIPNFVVFNSEDLTETIFVVI
jgi:hypothetical protein